MTPCGADDALPAAGLAAYAERVLAGTGINASDLPGITAEQHDSAVHTALRDGWLCAQENPAPGGGQR
ncbi:hypothetical protein [Antrihabitans spumae]|uniref:DUF732 domain-containing protein n=1 Tax=Antrihabitans spumae TaxID=3373370 RepID=A0ABW7JPP9_9NOCA